MIFARWNLADLRDEPLTHMKAIVETLQRLKAADLLSPQQARMLPDAEASLTKLTGP
jgi:hypothetical protein